MSVVTGLVALILPLWFAIRMRNTLLAICFGTGAVWVMAIVGSQYSLATDTEYNSLAPGVTIVAGWLPGLVYSLFCALVVIVCSRVKMIMKRPSA